MKTDAGSRRKATFEEILARDGKLVCSSVGSSMLPMIRQGRDLLVIRPPEGGRLKKYDVPLYRRKNGAYVLHRILEVRKDDYVLCGDNQWRRETGVTDAQIIGVLSAVVRGGREIPLSSLQCRFYALVWCGLFPVRAAVLSGLHLVKKAGRKLRNE